MNVSTASPILENCLFCNSEIIQQGLLGETEHFYLRASMQGAMAPGHVMLISKEHLSCFGAMDEKLDTEYTETLEKLRKVVEQHFGETYIIEQGIYGQSVPHAHIHVVPLVSSWYDFSPQPHKKMLLDYLPREIPISKGKNIKDIRRVFKEDGQYISLEERGQLYLCHTKNYPKTFSFGRYAASQQSGRTELSDWKTMPENAKEENKRWIKETLQKLKGKLNGGF